MAFNKVRNELIVQNGVNTLVTTGGPVAYTATWSNFTTYPTQNTLFTVEFNVANSANPTLNINTLGAKDIYSTATDLPLVAGDIIAGVPYEVTYNPGNDRFYLNIASSSVEKYATTFTAVTTFTVLGTTHNLGTDIGVHVYETSGTDYIAIGADVIVDNVTGDVTVNFASATTGRIVIFG